MPEGLNEKILKHLELFRIGEEETEEPVNLEEMSFERYMKLGKPNQQKQ